MPPLFLQKLRQLMTQRFSKLYRRDTVRGRLAKMVAVGFLRQPPGQENGREGDRFQIISANSTPYLGAAFSTAGSALSFNRVLLRGEHLDTTTKSAFCLMSLSSRVGA